MDWRIHRRHANRARTAEGERPVEGIAVGDLVVAALPGTVLPGDFAISAPDTVLAGLATATETIRLGTAVSVLSSDDPVRVHERFDDAGLLAYLRGLDVSVLGYGHGTHSGWLELCHDLGTRVLAPHTGFYHEQHPGVLGFDWDHSGRPDEGQIDAALASLR